MSRSNLTMVRRLRELESEGMSRVEALSIVAEESASRSASVLSSARRVTQSANRSKSTAAKAGAQFSWSRTNAALGKERLALEEAWGEFLDSVSEEAAGAHNSRVGGVDRQVRRAVEAAAASARPRSGDEKASDPRRPPKGARPPRPGASKMAKKKKAAPSHVPTSKAVVALWSSEDARMIDEADATSRLFSEQRYMEWSEITSELTEFRARREALRASVGGAPGKKKKPPGAAKRRAGGAAQQGAHDTGAKDRAAAFMADVRATISRYEAHAKSLGEEADAIEAEIAAATREIVGPAAASVRASSLRALTVRAESVRPGSTAMSDVANLRDFDDEDEGDDDDDDDEDDDVSGGDNDSAKNGARGRSSGAISPGMGAPTPQGPIQASDLAEFRAKCAAATAGAVARTQSPVSTPTGTGSGARPSISTPAPSSSSPRPSSSSFLSPPSPSSATAPPDRGSAAGRAGAPSAARGSAAEPAAAESPGGVDLASALAAAGRNGMLAPFDDGASLADTIATEAIGGIDIGDIEDDAVRTKYILQAGRLAAQTRAKLAEAKEKFLRGFPAGTSRQGLLSRGGPFGWTAEEHARLVDIARGMPGATPSDVADRAVLEMPARPREAVLRQLDWHRRRTSMRRSRRAEKEAWLRTAAALTEAAHTEARLAEGGAERGVLAAMRTVATEADALSSFVRAEPHRLARLERLVDELEEAEREEEGAQARREREREERAEHIFQVAEKARLAREAREARERERHEREAEEARKEAERVREAIREAAPRVDRRNEELAARRAEAGRLAAEEELRRELREEALRAKLKAEAEANVNREPGRVLQPTVASSTPAVSGKGGAPINLHPYSGYSSDQVMADSRVRLSLALAERGIGNSDAARHAIAHAKPATAPRFDNFDHGQIAAAANVASRSAAPGNR